jgi:hypothetical protein
VFEWWHDGCDGKPPQHELQRVVSRGGNTYTLSYAKRTAVGQRLEPAQRTAQLERLRNATLR